MKVLRYVIVGLLLAAMLGIAGYAIFVTKDFTAGDIIKFAIAFIGVILGLFKKPRRTVANKKAVYQKAYEEFLTNVFTDDKKLENLLYEAIHDYNQDKPEAAIKKLQKLRPQCQRSNDLWAVTVFTALCRDDLGHYPEAIEQYNAALSIRPSSTLYSNVGTCYKRMGDFDRAIAAYERALQINSKNAFAYNNLCAVHFARGDFEEALKNARAAIAINQKMPQALSAAAACCALLGDQAGYEQYYRQAVANGYDGQKIKNLIKSMDPSLP